MTTKIIRLAFFNDSKNNNTKNKITLALRNIENSNINRNKYVKKQLNLKIDEIHNCLSKNIKHFILCKIQDFFKRFDINFSFTELSPTT